MADKPESLDDLYIDELKDLWSANDQMLRVLREIGPKASEPKLQKMLEKSVDGIQRHTDVVKELIEEQEGEVSKEHCKGMEGLVAEARKHILQEGPDQGPVLDAVIIAQFQRMTHYGLAGFGTAAAYAEALGLEDAADKLDEATEEIYGGDEYATQLAETLVNLEAADEDEDA
jgi:ferritin-like metal-binding protein YciE